MVNSQHLQMKRTKQKSSFFLKKKRQTVPRKWGVRKKKVGEWTQINKHKKKLVNPRFPFSKAKEQIT